MRHDPVPCHSHCTHCGVLTFTTLLLLQVLAPIPKFVTFVNNDTESLLAYLPLISSSGSLGHLPASHENIEHQVEYVLFQLLASTSLAH